jgi:hypothetical protein
MQKAPYLFLLREFWVHISQSDEAWLCLWQITAAIKAANECDRLGPEITIGMDVNLLSFP